MSMSSIPSHSPSGKLYGWVERIGNKVPHPFLLFIYLIVILMVATAVLSAFDVSVRSPADGSLVAVKNLLSVDGLHWFLPNVIKNFSGFAPLGAILALVLGAGLAERVGLLPALMVKMASHVSARYASYMVLFIAFFSHISSDAALVIMPPMGALIFLAVGRHPVAGLLSAIAGVGCGFTANLLIVTTDVLLSGISTEAAKTIDAATFVRPRPPRIQPTPALAKRMMRSVMPPPFIRLPAMMKPGMQSRTNESTPAKIFCGKTTSGISA